MKNSTTSIHLDVLKWYKTLHMVPHEAGIQVPLYFMTQNNILGTSGSLPSYPWNQPFLSSILDSLSGRWYEKPKYDH